MAASSPGDPVWYSVDNGGAARRVVDADARWSTEGERQKIVFHPQDRHDEGLLAHGRIPIRSVDRHSVKNRRAARRIVGADAKRPKGEHGKVRLYSQHGSDEDLPGHCVVQYGSRGARCMFRTLTAELQIPFSSIVSGVLQENFW